MRTIWCKEERATILMIIFLQVIPSSVIFVAAVLYAFSDHYEVQHVTEMRRELKESQEKYKKHNEKQ